MDLTTLTSAVDFSAVSTALLTVGAAVVGVHITYRAIKWVLRAI